VALQLGLRHPERVRKLVIASASYSSEGLYPEVVGGIEHITPEMFDGTPWREAYDRVAPDPSAFPALVEKLKRLDMTAFDWPIDDLPGTTHVGMLERADLIAAMVTTFLAR
jgi:pimeloyl-ACP methyl ester carboxylesterase